jgi:hypothetical protein
VKAQDAAKDFGQRTLDDLKERALANPAAALAIAAGVLWRVVHRPPIASLLIGLGVVSLSRSSPAAASSTAPTHDNADETRHVDESPGIVPRATEMAASIRDKADEWADQATKLARDAGDRVSGAVKKAADHASEGLQAAASTAATVANKASVAVQEAVPQPDARDKYLLGFAALAITTAFGMALRRSADQR